MADHLDPGSASSEPPERDSLTARSRHLDLETLCALADDSLPAQDRPAVMDHLASCPACARDYREITSTVQLLRQLPQYQPRRTFAISSTAARSNPQPTVGGPGGISRWIPSQQVLRISAVTIGLVLCVVATGDFMIDDERPRATASVMDAIDVSTAVPDVPAVATVVTETVGTASASSSAASVAGVSLWTIAEIGLGLLLLWLIVSMVGRAFLARQDELPG